MESTIGIIYEYKSDEEDEVTSKIQPIEEKDMYHEYYYEADD